MRIIGLQLFRIFTKLLLAWSSARTLYEILGACMINTTFFYPAINSLLGFEVEKTVLYEIFYLGASNSTDYNVVILLYLALTNIISNRVFWHFSSLDAKKNQSYKTSFGPMSDLSIVDIRFERAARHYCGILIIRKSSFVYVFLQTK